MESDDILFRMRGMCADLQAKKYMITFMLVHDFVSEESNPSHDLPKGYCARCTYRDNEAFIAPTAFYANLSCVLLNRDTVCTQARRARSFASRRGNGRYAALWCACMEGEVDTLSRDCSVPMCLLSHTPCRPLLPLSTPPPSVLFVPVCIGLVTLSSSTRAHSSR